MGYDESGTVEYPIIKELKKLGWQYVTPEEMRKRRNNDLEEILLIDDIKQAIKNINSHLELTDADLDFAIHQLKTIPPTTEGIKRFLDYFRNGMLITIQKENKEEAIRLFDLKKENIIKNNQFIVTNQFRVEGPLGNIRADVVLFINGIPLVLIEAKSPTAENADWTHAYTDIKIYEEKAPDLFKYVQISVATDGEKNYYFPNAYNEEGKDFLNQWKDAYPYKNDELGNDKLKIMVYGLLSKENLLDLIENFTFIREEKSGTTKVTARYMQFRATKEIFKRVIERLEGKNDKKFGLIWHWQGSGKTYTMAFSSWKLWHSPETERPSIFILVDRKDLEEQIEKDFSFIKVPIERVESIKGLIDRLTWGKEGKRGIFLVTIEKFSPKEFAELEKKTRRLEIQRKNVIVFADEVHRTQYGKLATLMRSVFANASLFGFTGTPLSKSERNTFQKFCPPEELNLDRYSMLDALNDGVTVRISYQPRLPEYHLKPEQLKGLANFEEMEIQGLTEAEKKVLKKKVRATKAFLMKDKRIQEITKNLADHFTEIVESTGMKAMVVTLDRSACVKYKKFLDDVLDPDYSEVVMSFGSKEKEKEIRQFVAAQQKRYATTDQKEIHSKIIDDFKTKDKPKILIVTDMLITGFDSPNLWTMYIDKSLKEHRVLQATARTNRPFRNKKFGLIVDYIGILKELEKAFTKFEARDAEELRTVIRDLAKEEEEFKKYLTEALSFFGGVKRENTRESLNEALQRLVDPEVARRYEDVMKELMKSYEMLMGEPSLRAYLNDYTWLTKTYVGYNTRYKKADIDEMKIEQLSKKTMELIQETIDVDEINQEYPAVNIDESFIETIRRLGNPSVGAAVDVISNLQREARKYPNSPFFINISKQIENAYNDLRTRKTNVDEVMQRALDITTKMVERKKEEQKTGKEIYSIYEMIQNVTPDVPREKAIEFSDKLLNHLRTSKLLFKGWQEQREVRRRIKAEIRLKLLSEFKGRSQDVIDNLMDGVFTALEGMR